MAPKFSWRFAGIALLAAWLFDQFFLGKTPGITFPLWVFLLLVSAGFLAWGERTRISRLSYLLAGLVFISSLAVFLRGDVFTRILGALVAIFGIFALVGTFRTGNWFFYRLYQYLIMAFWLVIAAFQRPFSIIKKFFASSRELDPSAGGWRGILRRILPFLRGLLLALPVLLLLSMLLASADLIFKQQISNLLGIFDLKRLPEYFFRLIYILIFTYLFMGLFLHAILPSRLEERPVNQKTWIRPFLGMVESGIILSLVDALFLFFVLIQVRYLFGGESNITQAGFTYSEYARRGFWELVAVAILSLGLYLCLSTITSMESKRSKILFTSLSVLLLVLVMVILASAFQRLYLYEQVYNFTRLSTYTHVFILWLALLLLALIGLEVFRKRHFFTVALLLSIFGFVLTLSFINVDGFIARRNIAISAEENTLLDVDYLKTLSSDATPALIEGFIAGKMREVEKQELGMELGCRTVLAEERRSERPWQSYNLSDDTELRWLRLYSDWWEPEYKAFQRDGSWFVRVGGFDTSCRQDLFFD